MKRFELSRVVNPMAAPANDETREQWHCQAERPAHEFAKQEPGSGNHPRPKGSLKVRSSVSLTSRS
jgi:hypothetical protein